MNTGAFNQKHWVLFFVTCLAVMIAGVLVVNYLVDPYSVFDHGYFSSYRAYKNKAGSNVRKLKTYEIKRQKPLAVLLGTSVVDSGLNPKHLGEHVYNLGLPGANIYEVRRYFEFVVQELGVKEVYLGLEFLMFLSGTKNYADYNEARIRKEILNSFGRARFAYKEYFPMLFSQAALEESAKVLTKKEKNLYLEKNGFRDLGRIDYLGMVVAQGGFRESFDKNDKYYFEQFENAKALLPNSMAQNLLQLNHILNFAHKNNVKLNLFFTPPHSRRFEIIRLTGLWSAYENWKRQVVLLNESVAGIFKKTAFSVIDFAIGSVVEQEPIPNEKQKRMRYFFESSHFVDNLGRLVLGDLAEYKKYPKLKKGKISQRLDSKNQDSQIQALRLNQKNYAEKHPNEIRDLEKLHLSLPEANSKISL